MPVAKKTAKKTAKKPSVDALLSQAGDAMLAAVDAAEPIELNKCVAQMREKFLDARRHASFKMKSHRQGQVG